MLRVDTAAGQPLATLWNFAIHGICFDAPNMQYSSDVMGSVSAWVEANVGGVALFMNADAGDVNPSALAVFCFVLLVFCWVLFVLVT